VASVALDAAAAHEELADATSHAFRQWVGVLAEALEAEGRSPAEAHGLATLVIAAIEGTVTMAKGMRSTEPVATVRDQLRTILGPG
jgi:TetR/AcrR family transcriptional repressor of lmrAB and yxaGH operons